MAKKDDAAVKWIATAMARAEHLEYVIQMPANKRVKSDNFDGHVRDRMEEARRFLMALRAAGKV